MPSKKGQRKFFSSAIIIAIITGKSQNHTGSKKPVGMDDVAEVNEHLFPYSGKCMGLLVGPIAWNKSRPKILRQLSHRPPMKNAGMLQASPGKLRGLLGHRVSLVSTGA